jgi:hypothetical protein
MYYICDDHHLRVYKYIMGILEIIRYTKKKDLGLGLPWG